MRVDRGVRLRAVVLAALLAAATPASAAIASPFAAPATASVLGLLDEDPQPEPVTEAARAAALAEPAIVLIEVRWEGHVRDRDTGDILDPDVVSASIRCTGVGVGHDGYLLTTRSCLEQSAVAVEAFQQVVDRRVADGSVPAAAADDLFGQLLLSATIGPDPTGDDPPERSVVVKRAVTDDEPMPASVVASAGFADGDAALLKISRSNQPMLPLAGDDDLALGTELVTVECPAATDDVVGVAATPPPGGDGAEEEPLRPTFRTGTVAETSQRVLVEPDEPSAMPAGGVVLTHDAAIAGLVDTSLASGDLLVDLSVIRELLAKADVDTELGQVDRDYRAGLDAYYEGRYGDAIARLDSVLAIIPSHLQAHQYRDSAQSLRDAQDEPPPPADEVVDRVEGWLGGRSWSLVGVLVLIAIVVFLVRRRHTDAAPAEDPPSEAAPANGPATETPAPGTTATETTAAEAPRDAGRR